MRRGLMTVLFFAFLFSMSFVVAGSCDPDQTIFRLYSSSDSSASNAHASAYDQYESSYLYEVCYDEVFSPRTYEGSRPHDDSGYNDLFYVYSQSNSHGSFVMDSTFSETINYGNLQCEADTTMGSDCSNGGVPLVRMAATYNSHFADVGADEGDYPVKLCCYDVYWADMNGRVISEAQVGDTVTMVAPYRATQEDFEIKERDFISDDDVRSVEGSGDDFRYNATWTISDGDYQATSGGMETAIEREGIDREFFFSIGGLESPMLIVSSHAESDDPTVINFTTPKCGDYFNQSIPIYINVSVDDADDLIEGNMSIYNSDGDMIDYFLYDNSGLSLSYTFDDAGEYQIVAFSENSRGDKYSTTSNVMVLEVSGNTYVDGNYTAACLASPVSHEDYGGDENEFVLFDARPTRGVRIRSGVLEIVTPQTDNGFVWNWEFGVDDGAFGDNILGAQLNSGVASNDTKWYYYTVKYPKAGRKTATLSISSGA